MHDIDHYVHIDHRETSLLWNTTHRTWNDFQTNRKDKIDKINEN